MLETTLHSWRKPRNTLGSTLWCIAAGSPLLSPLETKAQSPLWPEPVATSGRRQQRMDGYSVVTEALQLTQRPALVYYASVDGSAIAGMDYRPVEGVLVFPAGHNSPTPVTTEFKRSRHTKCTLPDAFGIEMLADLTRPTALIASTGHEWLRTASMWHKLCSSINAADHVYHISRDGGSVPHWSIRRRSVDQSGHSLCGSPFGNGFYISSNNRDGHQEGDWGGTIQRFDPISGWWIGPEWGFR